MLAADISPVAEDGLVQNAGFITHTELSECPALYIQGQSLAQEACICLNTAVLLMALMPNFDVVARCRYEFVQAVSC